MDHELDTCCSGNCCVATGERREANRHTWIFSSISVAAMVGERGRVALT